MILQDFVFQEALSQDRPKTIQAWPNTAQYGTKKEPRRAKEPQERPKLLGVVSRWPQDGHHITRDGLKMASQCLELSQEGLQMATR